MGSIGPRLTRLEKATSIEDESAPRNVVIWYGDEEPGDLQPGDKVTVLPRKSSSVEEWQALCHELLDQDPDDGEDA